MVEIQRIGRRPVEVPKRVADAVKAKEK